jgi:iron complex outermembrane receptor protein
MSATAAAATSSDLADLSLEELARIEVTSVSRRPEQLSHAAASIYIITGEAIRHSGASSLPEALRLAPNLQVARLDSNSYAITARGFNNAIGNKLLVLIDGRTVYASFFSGVLWDQQDVMLEDVERIEVISGPGATLWGANAVNGVINVITKAAADTPGGLVSVRGGNRENGASLRYGTAIGDSGHLRVYAKSTRQENSRTASGQSVADGSTRDQLGFRSEWLGAGGKVTLQGDAYQGKTDDRGFFGPFALGPLKVSGSNLVARWTRQFSNGSDLQVQAFYDHMKREDALLYRPEAEVSDIEFQHGLLLGAANKLLWGGGYRRAHDDIRPGVFFGFVPASRTLVSKNLFVQGEFKLHPTLELTLGLKL